jgi:3-phosphoshikimate 1-carboxyvinyltransferase
MKLVAAPGGPLSGIVVLPGDKSLSHRAALFAALADGKSRIENFLVAGVTDAMLGALTALGVAWELDGTTLMVEGRGVRGLQPPAAPLNCGNSATTLRLLTGALAASGVPAVLDGSPGLRKRPMNRIVAPLLQMGVDILTKDGCAPLTLMPSLKPLNALDYTLPVASAQVKSCLLLAALAAAGSTTLCEPGPSRDHTERMLSSMGVKIVSHHKKDDETTELSGTDQQNPVSVTLTPPSPLSLKPLNLSLPADISSAAFLIVAALLVPGSQITLPGVGLNPTRTGLLDVLLAMGADIQVTCQEERYGEPVGDLTVRTSSLHGTQVSGSLVVRMIDEFPAFAVAASFAQGETVVSQAEELRHKESDRITALCTELRSLGVDAREEPDGFVIRPGRHPEGGFVNSHGDHRLAMALSLLGLAAQGETVVDGSEMISESFPEFVPALQGLGAKIKISA